MARKAPSSSGGRGAESAREHRTELVVRVEPTQFFGEALAQTAAGKRELVRGLARLRQLDNALPGALEADLTTGPMQHDSVDTRRRVAVSDVDFNRYLKPETKPRGEQCR